MWRLRRKKHDDGGVAVAEPPLEEFEGDDAALHAEIARLTEENRALRAELWSTQRQLLQVAWGLVAALLGAAAALVASMV